MFLKVCSEKKAVATILHPHQQPCLKHIESPDLRQTLRGSALFEDPEVNKRLGGGSQYHLENAYIGIKKTVSRNRDIKDATGEGSEGNGKRYFKLDGKTPFSYVAGEILSEVSYDDVQS